MTKSIPNALVSDRNRPSPRSTKYSPRTEQACAQKSLLMIGNFFPTPKGSRTVGEDLATKLQQSHWSVAVTSHYRGKAARLIDMMRTVWLKRNSFAVAQVDVYSGPAFIWSELTCELLCRIGKPYLLTLHGGNLPAFARRWPRRVRRLLRSAYAVTTPSRYLLEAMRHFRSDLCLLPNAVDLEAYAFKSRESVQPSLIWLRAFHDIYNPSLGPKTLACLAREVPDIHLTMIGPDTKDGSLQSTMRVASDLNILGRLEVLGPVPKATVPNRLAEADIFLNTASIDNAPVSAVEAMACGLCIVSTNVGGIPYLLEDGQDALLVPPNNPEAMASAVRRVLRDPGLAKRLSRNARRKAERFDWSNILPQWEELLLKAVHRVAADDMIRGEN